MAWALIVELDSQGSRRPQGNQRKRKVPRSFYVHNTSGITTTLITL